MPADAATAATRASAAAGGECFSPEALDAFQDMIAEYLQEHPEATASSPKPAAKPLVVRRLGPKSKQQTQQQQLEELEQQQHEVKQQQALTEQQQIAGPEKQQRQQQPLQQPGVGAAYGAGLQDDECVQQWKQQEVQELLPDADLIRTQMALHVNGPATTTAAAVIEAGGGRPLPMQQQELGAASEEYVYDFYIADAAGWHGEVMDRLEGVAAGGAARGMEWEGVPLLQVGARQGSVGKKVQEGEIALAHELLAWPGNWLCYKQLLLRHMLSCLICRQQLRRCSWCDSASLR